MYSSHWRAGNQLLLLNSSSGVRCYSRSLTARRANIYTITTTKRAVIGCQEGGVGGGIVQYVQSLVLVVQCPRGGGYDGGGGVGGATDGRRSQHGHVTAAADATGA